MKTLITFLLAFLCLNASAQYPGENRNDYSPYALDYSMLSLKMRLLSHHEDATQITYFDLNFVEQLMQDFMRKEMGMTTVNSTNFIKHDGVKTFTITYAQMATMGTNKIPKLYLKYTFFTNKDNHPIIKSLNISGSSNKVVYFYAAYWPTAMNFDESKNKIAFNYLLQDKATIRFDGEWSISVENTTIHDLKEYYRELNANMTQRINLENAYSKKQKATKDSLLRIATKDSIYRDSLIKLARKYKIAYSQTTDALNPSTDWLKTTVSQTENRLNSGNNYNTCPADSIIRLINKNLKPDKNYLTGVLVLRINKDGIIEKVETEGLSTISKQLLESINQIIDDQKISPYSLDGKCYPSYKRYWMQFIPTTMREYSLTDAGQRRY